MTGVPLKHQRISRVRPGVDTRVRTLAAELGRGCSACSTPTTSS